MKIQFKILMFMLCLNLSVGLAIQLGVAGTEYFQPTNPSNASEYEEHFNATAIADRWEATPFSGIPIVGDIFSGFQFLFQNIQYLLDGFPMFLQWVSDTYLTDATARLNFSYITNTLRAIFAVLMSIMVIEFISGRYLTD